MAFNPPRPYCAEEQELVNKIADLIRLADAKPECTKRQILNSLEHLFLMHNNNPVSKPLHSL